MAKKKKYGSGTGTPAMNITNNPNATQMPKPKGYGKGTGTPKKNISNNPNATAGPGKKKAAKKKASSLSENPKADSGAKSKRSGGKSGLFGRATTPGVPKERKESKSNRPASKKGAKILPDGQRATAARSH